MIFWNSFAFFMIQWIWSLVPLPFLNPVWASGSSQFTCCWSLAWRILSIILLAWEMSVIVWEFEHCLVQPFLGTGMNTDLFQSCGHCWIFQTCWHIEYNLLTASSFRILNTSAWISSSPIALLAVVIPKTHLTTHSRMPGSGWVITPLWLSSSLRSFCRVLCILVIPFLDFLCFYYVFIISVLYWPIFACSFDASNFIEEVYSLSLSIVFPYLIALFIEEGLLFSPCYSVELYI